MIAITSDIDWAPEEVIDDFFSFFEEKNINCTLFCTHESEIIKSANKNIFELSIHPNFNELLKGQTNRSAEQIIDNLLRLYPHAKGVRSHSMTQSTGLLDMFKNKGLIYDSNQFIPFNTKIRPYNLWNGMKRIPYNWEDDIVWMYGKKFSKNWIYEEFFENLDYWVFDFHPIHVYLNTDCESTYLKAKKYYHNPKELIKKRNNKVYGVRDFLNDLLSEISSKSIKTNKLSELC